MTLNVEREAHMARKPLYLRSMDPGNSFALNMRIADAVMDYVEARVDNTPEEAEMLREVKRRLREITHNVETNGALVSSFMLG